jgi:hypothetical protein
MNSDDTQTQQSFGTMMESQCFSHQYGQGDIIGVDIGLPDIHRTRPTQESSDADEIEFPNLSFSPRFYQETLLKGKIRLRRSFPDFLSFNRNSFCLCLSFLGLIEKYLVQPLPTLITGLSAKRSTSKMHLTPKAGSKKA